MRSASGKSCGPDFTEALFCDQLRMCHPSAV